MYNNKIGDEGEKFYYLLKGHAVIYKEVIESPLRSDDPRYDDDDDNEVIDVIANPKKTPIRDKALMNDL